MESFPLSHPDMMMCHMQLLVMSCNVLMVSRLIYEICISPLTDAIRT